MSLKNSEKHFPTSARGGTFGPDCGINAVACGGVSFAIVQKDMDVKERSLQETLNRAPIPRTTHWRLQRRNTTG